MIQALPPPRLDVDHVSKFRYHAPDSEYICAFSLVFPKSIEWHLIHLDYGTAHLQPAELRAWLRRNLRKAHLLRTITPEDFK